MQPSLKCHFLVIENNPDEAFLVQRAFTKVAHRATVFVCRTVSEATSYLRGAGMYGNRLKYPMPEGIVSDLHMPGENGLDFLRWLRADEAFKQLPLIILTGSSAPAQAREAYDLGANNVLEKPATLPELTALIDRLAEQWCELVIRPR